ncbi:MAG: hypothetical protein V1735_07195 [Nanoarchaeota archaeon]
MRVYCPGDSSFTYAKTEVSKPGSLAEFSALAQKGARIPPIERTTGGLIIPRLEDIATVHAWKPDYNTPNCQGIAIIAHHVPREGDIPPPYAYGFQTEEKRGIFAGMLGYDQEHPQHMVITAASNTISEFELDSVLAEFLMANGLGVTSFPEGRISEEEHEHLLAVLRHNRYLENRYFLPIALLATGLIPWNPQ